MIHTRFNHQSMITTLISITTFILIIHCEKHKQCLTFEKILIIFTHCKEV